MKMLVLGGNGFIGRHFAQCAASRAGISVSLLSRGQSNQSSLGALEHLVCDRENADSCRNALGDRTWDRVVDFSGQNFIRVANILKTIRTDHYTFLSSSAVDLAYPGDPYLPMAMEKLWCESRIEAAFPSLHVRAGFVVGEQDNTDRFENRDCYWYWRGTTSLVRPVIEVDVLVNTMLTLAIRSSTGIVRAGY